MYGVIACGFNIDFFASYSCSVCFGSRLSILVSIGPSCTSHMCMFFVLLLLCDLVRLCSAANTILIYGAAGSPLSTLCPDNVSILPPSLSLFLSACVVAYVVVIKTYYCMKYSFTSFCRLCITSFSLISSCFCFTSPSNKLLSGRTSKLFAGNS